jgi:tetratricopeptide (TPR) repeat protein
MRRTAIALMLALAAGAAHAVVDLDAMWDYARPAESEARFRAVLARVNGDDALLLRTQIARTYSLRGLYAEAHRELDIIEPLLPSAKGAEPKVRTLLERGRTLRSSGQPVQARPLFVLAYQAADKARLQALAGDALHMVALVEPTLDGRLEWNRRTVEYARRASDPKARRWEAPALSNMGVALNEAGRHDEALAVLRDALVAYERAGAPGQVRTARWMVAHTLRLLKRTDEALAMQLDLERQLDAAGETDPYVYEELSLLYQAKGDRAQAARYRRLHAKAK